MIDVETIFDSDREEYEFMKEKKEKPMKEQIEEMASIMCHQYNSGKCLVYGKCEDNCSFREDYKRLYNAGYRKQKEGEWITSDIPQEKYVCSFCGGACWYYDYQGDVAKSKYCPNCGAKMKGGAE